jgi:hypothetical protein
MTKEEFYKLVNAKRIASKSWYSFIGIVDNKSIRLKGFRTWLQVYEVDDVKYGGLMDISVKQFNQELEKPFT